MADYYKILGINKNASAEEIKAAYRELVKKYHPDKYYGKPEYQQMNEKFKEINEAYQVLSDLTKRQMYDQYGSAFEQTRAGTGAGDFGFRDWATYAEAMKDIFGDFSTRGGSAFDGEDFGFGDLGDIFSDFFGVGTRTKTRRSSRGHDLQFQMEISFREAVFGAEKEIIFDKFDICSACGGSGVDKNSKYITCSSCRGSGKVRQVHQSFFGQFQMATTCPKCGGEGKISEKECRACGSDGRVRQRKNLKIKIPAGIDNNESIVLKGQGEAGKKSGTAGHLYITFKVKPDPEFKRKAFDILSQKEISIAEAVLGGKVTIKTLDGEVDLKIPAGTKSGQVFKLRGKGVPRLPGGGRGDQLVTIEIKIPKHLTRRQKELLKELKKEGL